MAFNLSGGEASLIAFCYFITQLKDELSGPDAEKLIIYIDDPISSLDANHIFYVYSLIESILCEPLKYAQLFISTHNLEFLSILKRLTAPPIPEKMEPFLAWIYAYIERRSQGRKVVVCYADASLS